MRAVEQGHPHVDDGIPCDHAVRGGLLRARPGRRRAEIARAGQRRASDGIDELIATASGQRLDPEPHVAELSLHPAGLARELAFLLHAGADRLAIRDLRLADVRFDLELALHALDEHLEVQLAHAAGMMVWPDS